MSDYMKIDTNLPPYFPSPQFLMDMALSHTAALTYALLLDRVHLSQLNGWTDETGRVYIVFPIEQEPFISQEHIVRVVGSGAD